MLLSVKHSRDLKYNGKTSSEYNFMHQPLSFIYAIMSIGTLSIDNEMARRRRAEVKFSHARVLRMCDVVKTSSSLRLAFVDD